MTTKPYTIIFFYLVTKLGLLLPHDYIHSITGRYSRRQVDILGVVLCV
jgi:hypothetical protein